MPNREIVQSITLGRGKERISLSPGQVFDFTDEELEELEQSNPDAISTKTVIDLDEGDVIPKKQTRKLKANEKSAPGATGTGDTL